MNKYLRRLKDYEGRDCVIDVYDVLGAFKVYNPAVAHAVKKLLAPGGRGAKGWHQDVEEAIKSLTRALQMGPIGVKVKEVPIKIEDIGAHRRVCDCKPFGDDCADCDDADALGGMAQPSGTTDADG